MTRVASILLQCRLYNPKKPLAECYGIEPGRAYEFARAELAEFFECEVDDILTIEDDDGEWLAICGQPIAKVVITNVNSG